MFRRAKDKSEPKDPVPGSGGRIWRRQPTFLSWLMWPIAKLRQLGWAFRARQRIRTISTKLPVIFVSDPTVGGSSSAIVVDALSEHLTARGHKPGIFMVSSFVGVRAPVWIQPDQAELKHLPASALMHAQRAPTLLSFRAALIEAEFVAKGCDVIIVDNPPDDLPLKPNMRCIAVDANYGLGNKLLHPAGPLRVPLNRAFAGIGAMIILGEGPGMMPAVRQASKRSIRRLQSIVKIPAGWEHGREERQSRYGLHGRAALLWSTDPRPELFHQSLLRHSVRIAQFQKFRAGKALRSADAQAILDLAEANKLAIIAAEQDRIQLQLQCADKADEPLHQLLAATHVVPLELKFEQPSRLQTLIEQSLPQFALSKKDSDKQHQSAPLSA